MNTPGPAASACCAVHKNSRTGPGLMVVLSSQWSLLCPGSLTGGCFGLLQLGEARCCTRKKVHDAVPIAGLCAIYDNVFHTLLAHINL